MKAVDQNVIENAGRLNYNFVGHAEDCALLQYTHCCCSIKKVQYVSVIYTE